MPPARKKKKSLVQLELGAGGLVMVGIVSFIIFLWMFLLGMWAGQTVLQPDSGEGDGLTGLASKLWSQDQAPAPIESKVWTDQKNGAITASEELSKETFFTLQVAAFKDPDRASKVVLQWRARDYESFYLPPEHPEGTYYRVFVGNFDSMEKARNMASKLEVAGKEKFLITLLSAPEKRYP